MLSKSRAFPARSCSSPRKYGSNITAMRLAENPSWNRCANYSSTTSTSFCCTSRSPIIMARGGLWRSCMRRGTCDLCLRGRFGRHRRLAHHAAARRSARGDGRSHGISRLFRARSWFRSRHGNGRRGLVRPCGLLLGKEWMIDGIFYMQAFIFRKP